MEEESSERFPRCLATSNHIWWKMARPQTSYGCSVCAHLIRRAVCPFLSPNRHASNQVTYQHGPSVSGCQAGGRIACRRSQTPARPEELMTGEHGFCKYLTTTGWNSKPCGGPDTILYLIQVSDADLGPLAELDPFALLSKV